LARDLELIEKSKWNTIFRLDIPVGEFWTTSPDVPFILEFSARENQNGRTIYSPTATGLNPVEAPIFFFGLNSQLLKFRLQMRWSRLQLICILIPIYAAELRNAWIT